MVLYDSLSPVGPDTSVTKVIHEHSGLLAAVEVAAIALVAIIGLFVVIALAVYSIKTIKGMMKPKISKVEPVNGQGTIVKAPKITRKIKKLAYQRVFQESIAKTMSPEEIALAQKIAAEKLAKLTKK